MPGNNVRWNASARKQYYSALEYIMSDSVQNAQNVQIKLLKKLETVAQSPTKCPPDKYKIANYGTFRAFVLFRYRVSYRIKNNQIRVLRVRHSSMKPKYF